MNVNFYIQVIFMGLILGGIYALISLGLNLIYGTMRLLSIWHGEIIILGAFTAYWFFVLYGVSPLITLLLVVFLCAILGIVIFNTIFYPLIKTSKTHRNLQNSSLLIFFAFSIIAQNIASLLWGADLRKYDYMTQVVSLGSITITANRLVAFIIGIVLCGACYVFIQKTLIGKAIRALMQDRECCQLMGINIKYIYILCFMMSFAMAGAAGVLLSMIYVFSPFMGLSYTVIAFIVVILGGLGNIKGSILAGFFLGLVGTLGATLTSPGMASVLNYSIFVLVVLFRQRDSLSQG